ncbi:MAG: BrnA antitoxin family protein [Pandoraea sp.]|nr:BrnA antitoxin family protein [Pandoraea sp.]MDR3398754.1 BrnA antitoxin family protein [Pandoraea sp.]
MTTKRRLQPMTDAEDAAITRAAESDPDSPPLTDAQLRKMRPARDVLTAALGKERADALLKRRGRPPKPESERKVTLNMRADRDVVDAFKATGDGWQTRINEALREYAESHHLISA